MPGLPIAQLLSVEHEPGFARLDVLCPYCNAVHHHQWLGTDSKFRSDGSLLNLTAVPRAGAKAETITLLMSQYRTGPNKTNQQAEEGRLKGTLSVLLQQLSRAPGGCRG